jgi:hypothetical protein
MKRSLIYAFITFFLIGCSSNEKVIPKLFEFDLPWLALKHKADCQMVKSSHFGKEALLFQPSEKNNFIMISGIGSKVDWSNAKYLVCEVYNPNDCNAGVCFDFYKKTNSANYNELSEKASPTISPQIGVLPFIKTKIVLPLSALDGQSVSIERLPGQLTVFILGNRLDPKEVGAVHLSLSTPFRLPYKPKIEIASMYLTNDLPEKFSDLEKPVVDLFGQWNYKDWPGKVKDENQLKERILGLEKEALNARYPDEWSQYGGWKLKRFDATGYFRTQFDGKRWWLADPEGYAYLSNGIDVISPSMLTQIYKNKNEDFFEWLPSGNDTLSYKDAISKSRSRESGMNIINGKSYGYNFYVSNLIKVFGQDWRKRWEDMTINLIKKWRINSIANWSDIELAQKSKLPYVIPLRGFPSTKTLLYRDFPDVYSGEYQSNAVRFAKQLESFKNDRYLVGYFLSNEPKWAFTPVVMAYDESFNLAFEMFGNPQPSFTKKIFISWLKDRYKNNLESFNKEWNLQLTDFEALESKVLADRKSLTTATEQEMKEFSRLMADKYIKVVCDEVKKVDPNHLNLGMRYAWISNEYLYVAGSYFDVYSINGYFFTPPKATAEIYKRSGKPVMIGEFHFGSIDRGLPHPGLRAVANQSARGDAYRYYLEQGFTRPEIVGMNYFEWLDEPINGRYDGENFNIGVMDVCHQPYKELTDAIKTTNERLYLVADGQLQAFDKAVDQTY